MPLTLFWGVEMHCSHCFAFLLSTHSQREGVKFMYECVMGLKDFAGNGWYVCSLRMSFESSSLSILRFGTN